MRAPALFLCLAALAAGDDISLKAGPGLDATALVQALHDAGCTTLLYPPADLKDRHLKGRYDLGIPRERLEEAVEFLLGMCDLKVRRCPPVTVILPSSALETRFRAPGLDTEIQFDRGPGGWAKEQDALGSLSAASAEALLAEAAKGHAAALDILAAMGPRTPPTITAMAKLLADPALRPQAAAALARFGFFARPVLPALREVAKGDPAVEKAIREIEAARHPALLSPGLAADTAPARFVARFETTQGDFDVEVLRDWSPLAADRFHNLVRIGFFDGCRFFRVVKGFVAQFGKSGDPEVNDRWYSAAFKDEAIKETNKRGYLSFAMEAQPNSRGTQIFVNLKDNAYLDGKGFAAFGRVVQGMDVVDRFYDGYGESPDQGHLHYEGEEYLEKNFPKLDRIKRATIVE